jgi:hypothetical protein
MNSLRFGSDVGLKQAGMDLNNLFKCMLKPLSVNNPFHFRLLVLQTYLASFAKETVTK